MRQQFIDHMESLGAIYREAPDPISDLRTGEGHGHFRPSTREHSKRDRLQHKRAKRKLAKASRRRNRA